MKNAEEMYQIGYEDSLFGLECSSSNEYYCKGWRDGLIEIREQRREMLRFFEKELPDFGCDKFY